MYEMRKNKQKMEKIKETSSRKEDKMEERKKLEGMKL